ncbi:MAG: hypothetical protein ABH804_02695 [archaeon]
MEYNLEEGDVVMCTVDRIVGTVVFVKIDGNGEGGIILSEIAPGRIRNLRDYVVPKKRIVCKVLRILGDRIDLSLRRVTQKEQKKALEQFNLEKSYLNILKSVLKEKTDSAVEKITKEDTLYNFLEESKENPAMLEKIIEKSEAKKILEIIKNQKQKKYSLKKEISLTTKKPDGITTIKEAFRGLKNIKLKYISAGRYSLETEDNSIKSADQKIKEVFSEIEKRAKENNMEFSVIEKGK